MARRTIVELTDDLTGDAADETVRFAFDGKAYAIDLSSRNAEKFRKVIAPYVSAARREGTLPRQAGRTHVASDVDPKAVRAWALSNGYDVSSRGRVSADVVSAFKAARN